MSKQQVSRIKKVLTILLAVLFAVSLAAAAASNELLQKNELEQRLAQYYSEL